MNSTIQKIILLTCTCAFSIFSFGQYPTTAMDFNTNDCNGNPVHLFADLDAGNAVILFYYMPSCGSCIPPATDIQSMANRIKADFPGKVKAYSFPYTDVTDCIYSASWVVDNNLPLYAPMINSVSPWSYYGEFAMPSIVLLGGTSHDVMMVLDQGFDVSDTVAMRNAILDLLDPASSSIKESSSITTLLDMYPNPTSDLLHINFDLKESAVASVEMIDLEGKTIITKTSEILKQGMIKKEINVSQIPSGLYFIKLNIDGVSTTEKINIRH